MAALAQPSEGEVMKSIGGPLLVAACMSYRRKVRSGYKTGLLGRTVGL